MNSTLKSKLQAIAVIIVLCAAMLLYTVKNYGQAIAPAVYFQFNNPNPLQATTGGNIITPGGISYVINSGGPVGNYMTKDIDYSASAVMQGGNIAPTNAVTIQFLFKPGKNFQLLVDGYVGGIASIISAGSTSIGFAYPNVGISTSTGTGSYDLIPLSKIGKVSWQAIQDGNWHMITITVNGITGQRRLYIDGQSPNEFIYTGGTGNIYNGDPKIYFATTVSYQHYAGDLDEVAVYHGALTPNQVWQNYLDFQAGNHYTTVEALSVPAYSPTTASYSPTDYAPANTRPIDQLLRYSVPRIPPMAATDSIAMLSFSDPTYLGGYTQPWVPSVQQAANNAAEIGVQLAKDYNWALPLYAFSNGSTVGDTTLFLGKLIKRANANPQYKTQVVTFFSDPPDIGGLPSNYGNQSYPITNYIQNSSAQALNSLCDCGCGYVCGNGVYAASTNGGNYVRVARPSMSRAISNDGNHFSDDKLSPGIIWHLNAATLLHGALTRPLDYAVENGELFKRILEVRIQADPILANDMASANINYIGLQSTWVARIWKNYRDSIFGTGLARFANTKFAIYQNQGNTSFFYQWEQMKDVNFAFKGSNVSSSDYYVRGNHYFRYGDYAAFHGLHWFQSNDSSEHANGSHLNVPFVNAGYAFDEHSNTTPAQFLGGLKLLGVRGAVSYYSSYFTEVVPGPDVQNWIWQMAMPTYAQAITFRARDIIYHGYLMPGDVPLNKIRWGISQQGYMANEFNSGDYRAIVVVRKDSLENRYVIGTNFNRWANMVGDQPNSTTATITLGSEILKFESRNQGNVYVYDNRNTANKLFYQLDRWHEATHPYYWSTDFVFDAPVNDNLNQVQLKTYQRAGAPPGDYVGSHTNIAYADTTTIIDSIVFNFVPRVTATYYLWVKLKSKNGTLTSCKVRLGTAAAVTLPVNNTLEYYYRYDNGVGSPISYSLTKNLLYHLAIIPTSKDLEIAEIILTQTPNAGYLEPPVGPCTATSTITPSGATTFCTGGSVTLTANASPTYLWSNGATTQSVIVTTTGTYTVTVTDGSGCTGISSPVSVVVNPNPTPPVISPQGPTTFCSGGSVDLQASTGTTYLWSNGATTQTITVTTAATWTVTVTNASGCTASSASISTNVNALPGIPTITPSPGLTICLGNTTTLTSSAGITYAWSTGAITSAISTGTAGGYTVTITDANGCTRSSATSTVIIDSIPIIAPLTPVQNICPAVDFDLATLTLVNTGTAITVISYHSTLSDAQADINPIASTVVATAVYYIRGETAAGCYAVASISVQIVSCACVSPPTANAGPDQTICSGSTVTLAGSRTIATTSRWTTSGTGTFNDNTLLAAIYTPSAADTVANTVTLTLTTDSAAGGLCVNAVDAMVVTIIDRPAAVVTASGAVTFCQGGNVNLVVNPIGASYVWSSGQTTQSITVAASGVYKSTVTDVNGCTSGGSNTMTVLVNTKPVQPSISPGGPQTICSGSNIVLTSSTAPSGGTYLWSTGATTQAITVSTAGSYRVTVSNTAGCTRSSNQRIVTVQPVVATPIITPGGSTTICSGNGVVLMASGADSWIWSTGAITQSITATVGGNYTVTVTVNGCTAVSAAMAVTVNTVPTANITSSGPASNQLCYGTTAVLTATANTSYLWSTGEITQSIIVSTSGTYSVIVTNAAGCTKQSAPLAITVMPVISNTLTPSGATTFCQPNTVGISAPIGYNYLWSTGASISSISAGVSGNYTVIITDAAGCTSIGGPLVVIANPQPAIPVISPSSPVLICPTQSVTLTATSSAGYVWSTTATTQNISVASAGNYSVTVYNTNGCSRTSATTVVQSGSSVTATITPSGSTTFCAGTPFTLTASTSTSYLWSTGATTQIITPTISESYRVTVTDAFGCTKSSASIAVIVNPLPSSIIIPSGNLTFCDSGAVQLCAPVAPAGSTYTYLWSSSATYRCVTVATTGTYTVTVTSNGCTKVSASVNTLKDTSCVVTCGVPVGTGVNQITTTTANVYWSINNSNSAYKTFVMRPGLPKTIMPVNCTQAKRYVIYSGLKRGTRYQFMMIGYCNGIATDTTKAIYFKTLTR